MFFILSPTSIIVAAATDNCTRSDVRLQFKLSTPFQDRHFLKNNYDWAKTKQLILNVWEEGSWCQMMQQVFAC